MQIHLKNIVFLIIILVLNISCQSQKNFNIPYLTNSELSSIFNKKEKEIYYGDIVFSTTKGEYKLNELLTDSNSILTDKNKIEICIVILKQDNLYHLHDRAAAEISSKIDTLNFENNFYQECTDYIILRTNIQLNQVLYSGGNYRELDKEYIDKILKIINENEIKNQTKKYLIEALYSLVVSGTNGKYINDRINGFWVNDELKTYNDSLFKTYQSLKPSFESLDAIQTWKEMDKNYKAIYEMFENYHPIMFLQILSFNPSTVLESKELCELKQNALIETIKNAESKSFYSTYRLAYLTELLIERNYTVRFLDQLMDKSGNKELINELELKKY